VRQKKGTTCEKEMEGREKVGNERERVEGHAIREDRGGE
jgi:hypothetical protein